jgi:divalent metal cation (Fe/Co/Zn/Cd) transporter
MPNESTRTVVVALAAGFGVALAKAVAAAVTGSAAMAAEASHSLADTANDFLVGAWRLSPAVPEGRDDGGFTQPLQPSDDQRLQAFLLAYPGVTAIRELLVTFAGPGQVWVVARLDIDDDLSGAQVKSLVHGIESGAKNESENVYRVDVVPIGGAPAPP